MTHRSNMTQRETPRLQTLRKLMQDGETFAAEDVMVACFCCRDTALKMLRRLRKDKQTHIVNWRRGNAGKYYEVHGWGRGEDARKPKPLSDNQRYKRYNHSEKGEKRQKQYQMRNIALNRGLAGIDPLLAKLIGKPQQRSI